MGETATLTLMIASDEILEGPEKIGFVTEEASNLDGVEVYSDILEIQINDDGKTKNFKGPDSYLC